MRRVSGVLVVVVSLLIVAGCSKSAQNNATSVDSGPDAAGADVSPAVDGDLPGAGSQAGCNPLAQEYDCLLPYPSDAFRAGGVVHVEDIATPADKEGAPVRAFDKRTADGFSVHPSILFTFGGGLDPASLVGEADAATSITPTSATLLIDAETGTPVPHFSEVYLGGDEALQIGAIRPLVRLQEGHRYVVGIRRVRGVDGADVTPPLVFAALRDSAAVDPALTALSERFDADVFPVLEDFGVVRGELDLAWDFTVRSRDNLMGDMLSVRNGTLAWLQTNTPTVTITDVIEGADRGALLVDNTFRHVEGTFTAPLWTETDEAGSTLRGEFGAREIVGTLEVPFTLTIPLSIEADPTLRPARFIQYGHGFFGRREEVISAVQSEFGNQIGVVMGAVDWSGMARADREWEVGALTTGAVEAFGFVPRVHQGMSNQLVFTEVIKTLLVDDASVALGGAPSYDPDQVYFLGISQGHILGGTFFALSPSIDKAVLNVGGASMGLIITRSQQFAIYEQLMAIWLEPLELLKFEAMATEALEVIDPIAYAPLVLAEPLPGAVPKQVLLQGGVGDSSMPNASTELHARALGIGLVTPSAVSIPFIEDAPAPAASGLVFADFGFDRNTARPWKPVSGNTPVHDLVRESDAMRQQMDLFLRPAGQIEDVCSGACVLEP